MLRKMSLIVRLMGLRVFMPIPAALNPYKSVGVPEPEFYSDRFVYDSAKDVYVCPAGNEMPFWKRSNKGKGFDGRLYRSVLRFLFS
jgi:hypothetical protein